MSTHPFDETAAISGHRPRHRSFPVLLLAGLFAANACAQTFGTDCDSASPHFGYAAGTTKAANFKCLQYPLGARQTGIEPDGHDKKERIHWYLQTMQGLEGKCVAPGLAGTCTKTLARMCAASMQKDEATPGQPVETRLVGVNAECQATPGQDNPTGPNGCARPCIVGETKL